MAPTPPARELNDGTTLPAIGFGTYTLTGEEGTDAVLSALDAGYRLLDTAVNYENEEEVGQAIRKSSVARDEIVVATKIPGRFHARGLAVTSVEDSLRRLGLDHLDICLIHWPNPSVGLYVEAWRGLIDARERGLVRTIGVSNFSETHLQRVVDETGVTPALNQIELHPWFPQAGMRAAHDRLGIFTEAWSPLGKRRAPFEEAPVTSAADAHGVTPAQVVLRWHLQLGSLPIPKSATPERQRENLDVFGFELDGSEMDGISGLADPDGRLFGGDPDVHEEM